MDDNAPCHRTVAAKQLLESEDIERNKNFGISGLKEMGGVGTSSRMRWPSLVPSPRSKVKQMSISFMAPKFLPKIRVREVFGYS
ncbi:hypothetical protein TNCV_5052671 [Trichonephila clavipes]|nr:hypothetical protein TNCV_5052671 [Trichonephila clavipes]